MSKVLATCLLMAAQTYSVPPAVLVGIYNVEGGKVGQQVRNTNGTYDLGPMQINTRWMPELADYWGVSESTARKWVRDDPCTNMGVSAWILRKHLNETGSLGKAIAHYHSKTPEHGLPYKRKVVSVMERQGLLRPTLARTTAISSGTIGIVRAEQSNRFGKQARRSAPRGTSVASNNVGTVGLGNQTSDRVLTYQPNPYFGSTHQVGMNSIVVHNPISHVRD